MIMFMRDYREKMQGIRCDAAVEIEDSDLVKR